MAPSDVSNLLKVGITLVSSNGKDAEVTMQKLTLNRDSNWDASACALKTLRLVNLPKPRWLSWIFVKS